MTAEELNQLEPGTLLVLQVSTGERELVAFVELDNRSWSIVARTSDRNTRWFSVIEHLRALHLPTANDLLTLPTPSDPC